MDGEDDRDDRIELGDLVRRWRDEGDEEALRVAAQTMLLTPFDLTKPRIREAFDDLRGELGRLFLAASVREGKDRERARKVLSSLLAPEPRRGPPPRLAVTQRDTIVESYLAGVDDHDDRATRMAELENRILPTCKRNLEWPDDVSIDLDSVIRSLSRRNT